MDPPFSSKALRKFLALQYIDHITSSPHYTKSNGFIRRQIKTIKTTLDTDKSSGKSLTDLLLSLRSTPISPHLPYPWEILHNRTQDHAAKPPHPIDFVEVWDYLITQKSVQKKHHNHRHSTKDLPELHAGQTVLFLSPADANSYIGGIITGPAATPRSYMLETQGRVYHHNRQDISPMHIDTTSFPWPSMHQSNPIPGPSEQKDLQPFSLFITVIVWILYIIIIITLYFYIF